MAGAILEELQMVATFNDQSSFMGPQEKLVSIFCLSMTKERERERE